MFEAIRIRKAGYLIRVPHAQFIQRYKHCCPEALAAMRSAGESDPRSICAAMLKAMLLKVGNAHGADFSWAIGASRVFLKSMKLRLALEQLRATSVDSVAAQIQKVVRGFLVRCKLSKARQVMLERKRAQCDREQEECRRMGAEDARSMRAEEAFRSDLSERRKIEEARQLRLKLEREKKERHWNMSATLIQKRARGMIARIRWTIRKAEFFLERAIVSRSERLLEEAIVLTERIKSKPKKLKEICANAKILLVTVQGEIYVKSQLEDAMATQNDELISSAIRLAEDAGMTYLEEYSRGKQALDREVRRRAVLSHIQGTLDRCSSIPSLIKFADKLEGLVLTATNLGLSGEVLVQDATGRLRRVQSLLRVRDNIRVAVELCSVSLMKEAMRERHKLLAIYGPQFCEDEARAVLKVLQMFSHETQIAPATDSPKESRGEDGSESTSSFAPLPRNDVRLPPFVRQELDRIRDAKTASGELHEICHMRIFRFCFRTFAHLPYVPYHQNSSPPPPSFCCWCRTRKTAWYVMPTDSQAFGGSVCLSSDCVPVGVSARAQVDRVLRDVALRRVCRCGQGDGKTALYASAQFGHGSLLSNFISSLFVFVGLRKGCALLW